MKTDTRRLARLVVDDFTYDLHHSLEFDFTLVPSKEIVKLIDHIEQVIQMAYTGPASGAP